MIARKSFLVFLNMVAGSILGALAMFFIVRNLPGAWGLIGFGIGIGGLFSLVTDLGFNAAHVKRISEGRDLRSCIGTFFIIKLVLVGIMVGGMFLSVSVWKYFIGGFETPEHEPVIYLFTLHFVFLSLAAVPLATFSARRETAKQQMPGLVEPLVRAPLSILITLGVIGSYFLGGGAVAIAGAYVAGSFTLLVVSMALFRGYPFGKFDRELFKDYFKFAVPLAVSASIVTIFAYIDKVMLQLFGGQDLVEYYFTPQTIIKFIILISTAVTMLLFPTLSEHHGKDEHEEIRKLTLSAERYVSLVVLPCVVLLIIFSVPILNIFRNDIAVNASRTLQIMSVYALIFCFYMIFMNHLMAVDKPKTVAKIGISTAAIGIVLNIILIPKDIKSLGINLFGWGTEGAALATAIAAAFGLVTTKIMARRITGIKWNPRILLHIGAALVMGGVLYYLGSVFTLNDWYEVGGASLLGLGIYIGFLALLKEFRKEDLKLFMEIINPKSMKDYVVSELKDKENKK